MGPARPWQYAFAIVLRLACRLHWFKDAMECALELKAAPEYRVVLKFGGDDRYCRQWSCPVECVKSIP